MKTAEEWKQTYPGTLFEHAAIGIVRQIQADALRWAAEEAFKRYPQHDLKTIAACCLADIYRDKANQLDPKL